MKQQLIGSAFVVLWGMGLAFAAEPAVKESAAERSIAQLKVAWQCAKSGDLEGAKREYAKLAKIEDAPAHHQWEAAERIRVIERKQAGLPARDVMASRTTLPKADWPGVTLHVSPRGDDKNAGTEDRPFATLERARDEIRAMKKRGPIPAGGVAVLVHGGAYRVSRTFALSAEDSGTEAAPVVYRAAEGEKPRFSGGLAVGGFKKVEDPAVLSRLPEEGRGKVLQADLKASGILSLLPLKLGGFASGNGFRTHPAHELFFNGRAMQLARGPNDGFLRIKDVAVKDGTKGYDRTGSKVGKFIYDGDRPARWAGEKDLLLYGYWFWDWADSYERVESIDTASKVITLAKPTHTYGFSVNAPFYAINALCELDVPGEWYIDRGSQTLYFYPPADLAGATVELSMFADAMVSVDGASHVRMEGLTWELGSADAVRVRGGEGCVLAGCTVRNCAGNAVEIRGGKGNGVLSCDIHSMGRGGIILSGGDRKTLTPGRHFAENCDIHELSRIDHTYTPAVVVDGVGHRVAHNRLHDIASSAMRVNGNDHLVELNEVFRVALESDDQGGADLFGNPTFRGNVFRYNHWHHIGGGQDGKPQPKLGQAGIRLDDAICGTLIYGNIFHRSSTGKIGFGGVQIHGGKGNIVDNNVFVEGVAALSFTPWRQDRWEGFVKNALDNRAVDKALYLKRYPELADLVSNPNVNHIWRNIVVRCEFMRKDPKRNELIDNTVSSEGELKLDREAPLFAKPGFAPIPVEEIGLYGDAYRKAVRP